MSLQSVAGNAKLTGEGTAVSGLSLSANNSTTIGTNCGQFAIGQFNTFIGYAAAEVTRQGSFNTVCGYAAGRSIEGGNANAVFGFQAAQSMASGSGNVFVGANTGGSCVTGTNNVVIGPYANVWASTDSDAVAIGAAAVTGGGAICIGSGSTAKGNGSIAIGYRAAATGDGRINLGNRLFGYRNSSNSSNYVVELSADMTVISGGAMGFSRSNSVPPQWTLYLDVASKGTASSSSGRTYADLVLRSANHSVTRFTDEFTPGIFDFTGQHRCKVAEGVNMQNLFAGCILVSTGRYCDLSGESNVRIDEAVPIVDVSRTPNDKRVFGVVSTVEGIDEAYREFRLATMGFRAARLDRRVVVNAVGEGAVWVCDANGPLENGDLIVSSPVVGVGMRQSTNVVDNTTVAKITCDCDFESNVPGPIDVRPPYRCVLVGCTYKC